MFMLVFMQIREIEFVRQFIIRREQSLQLVPIATPTMRHHHRQPPEVQAILRPISALAMVRRQPAVSTTTTRRWAMHCETTATMCWDPPTTYPGQPVPPQSLIGLELESFHLQTN